MKLETGKQYALKNGSYIKVLSVTENENGCKVEHYNNPGFPIKRGYTINGSYILGNPGDMDVDFEIQEDLDNEPLRSFILDF